MPCAGHADMKSTKEELLNMKNAVQNARAQSKYSA